MQAWKLKSKDEVEENLSSKLEKTKMSQHNPPTDWFTEVPNIPDPYQEAKPRLTEREIKNAAKVYKTFVDPRSQTLFYHVMKNKFHKTVFTAWWPQVCGHNKNPVDEAYSVEEYIVDRNLNSELCPNSPCYCGACADD